MLISDIQTEDCAYVDLRLEPSDHFHRKKRAVFYAHVEQRDEELQELQLLGFLA